MGNWLLSAARVFAQEPQLAAPLIAAVCWTANSVHLSSQPAISRTLNTHALSLTYMFSSALLFCLPLFSYSILFFLIQTFTRESSRVQENADYFLSHNK